MNDDVRRHELTSLQDRVKRLEEENKRQMDARNKRWEWAGYGILLFGLLCFYTVLLWVAATKAADSAGSVPGADEPWIALAGRGAAGVGAPSGDIDGELYDP